MSNDIDFVVTWVDGKDGEWVKKRNKYNSDKNSDSRNVRYYDWGTLKYWFRSIEKYAPWVHRIYFVTDNQIPEWLKTEHEKLVIINHTDFIPKKYLPTFNSHTIELNFHRIKGLREKFVYFNDDTFLVNKVNERDFFKKGKPVDVANIAPVMPKRETVVTSAVRFNNAMVINDNFNTRRVFLKNIRKWMNPKYGIMNICTLFNCMYRNSVGYVADHQPSPFLKETFESVWDKEESILDETCACKFRNRNNVNQYLIKMWQLYSNDFYPKSSKKSKFITIRNENDLPKMNKILSDRRIKTACINDSLSYDNNSESVIKTILDVFEKKYPEKSSYEK